MQGRAWMVKVALGLVAGTFGGGVATARAQAPQADQGAVPAVDSQVGPATPARSTFPALPAMFETGRVARAYPEGGAPIGRQEVVMAGAETAVQKYSSPNGEGPRRGTIDRDQVDGEVANRMTSLRDCRYEAARAQQVPPNEMEIPALGLRFSIEVSGTTSDIEIIPEAATNSHVTACVKRVVSTWRFTGPSGGPVRVQYRATP